ncbi:hypothetical protein HBR94_18660 [Pseudomonas sp. WS 5412]|uniref:hypothetical protein n=1 Tax=Pseudomonas sp. WS 5412 TaxID=2717487 RepID=UPI00147440F9|nr:hypothetical protein [Pseudomonas sp. WS 5412]NMY33527.1 hypothetical protein [Pseudomonas sp. WS 5412]
MNAHCLICESSAVLSQDSAKAIVQFFTALNSFAREWQTTLPTKSMHTVEPMAWFLLNMTAAVASATSAFSASDRFIQDMHKYQFCSFTYLRLRCGARFDSVAP